MNDFIFNVLQPQGPTIPQWVWFVGGTPIAPLVGSFLGVVLGFGANYLAGWINGKRSKSHYIELFGYEFDQAEKTLQKDKDEGLFVNPLKKNFPKTIQIDGWTSAVNNGDLRLFKLTEVDRLSYLYSRIQDYNNEIQLYKSTTTVYGFPVGTDLGETSGYYPKRQRLDKLNNDIINKINDIKKEKWMSFKEIVSPQTLQ